MVKKVQLSFKSSSREEIISEAKNTNTKSASVSITDNAIYPHSYENLNVSLPEIKSILQTLSSNNRKEASMIVKGIFNLRDKPLPTNLILAQPFDPSNHQPPDLSEEDATTRDNISEKYLLDAIENGRSLARFDEWQSAVWLTIFSRTHFAYIERVQKNPIVDIKYCKYEFTRNLNELCYNIETKHLKIPFSVHQIKLMIDYFNITYIQHIMLITWTFLHQQARRKFSRCENLIDVPILPPLRIAILEENWETYLKEKRAVEQEKNKQKMFEQLKARIKKIEPEDEIPSESAEKNDSSLILAPLTHIQFPSPPVADFFTKKIEPEQGQDHSTPLFNPASIVEVLTSGAMEYLKKAGAEIEKLMDTQLQEMQSRVEMIKKLVDKKKALEALSSSKEGKHTTAPQKPKTPAKK